MNFRSIGGSTLWAQYALSADDVHALAGLFWDEQIAARNAQDEAAYRRAREACDELLGAYVETRRWARASGGVES